MRTEKDGLWNYVFARLTVTVTALVMLSWSSPALDISSRGSDGKVPSPISWIFTPTVSAEPVTQAGAVASESDLAIPERLRVRTTHVLSLQAQAAGVQIYECDVRHDDPTRFEWTFKAAEAELFSGAGEKIGRHYAGPTWESTDGSKVVAEVTALHPGPDPNAVPWLLLSATSNSGNVFGVFGRTQSVQRIGTKGGKAPAQICNRLQVGKQIRQPFKATYNFYDP